MVKKRTVKDFYEIQRQQWQKSLFLFLILAAFYCFAVSIVTFFVLLSVGLFFPAQPFFFGANLKIFILGNLAIAFIIALVHFYDARKFGAEFIRKRLQARAPDPNDRYHKQFANTVDEIRIAAGMPQVRSYIIPVFAINSMALIEADKTPSIIVTEGLLADFTRDELQAVVSHELAHIMRGDTFYITLVCSLGNFFERLRQAAEPEEQVQMRNVQPGKEYQGGQILVFLAASFSGLLMHLLSTLISREREILADAAAVEFSRNPAALAKAIYKAHIKNSFVGDFVLTYSPLFIVPPESRGDSDSLLSRIFNSHPPLMKRIRMLAAMIPAKPSQIVREVWNSQKNREKARMVLSSFEETPGNSAKAAQSPEEDAIQADKIWQVRNSKGQWQGPFNLQEIFSLQIFTPRIWMKNMQENIEAFAQEFPQVRKGLKNLYQKKHINPAKQNKCPRCRISLNDSFYEGTHLKICAQCQGKLIDAGLMDRIIARKEVAFSDHLQHKAKEFHDNFMWNPLRTTKIDMAKSPEIFCPHCGNKMLPRPYNYQYIVPVDKCLSCYKIWFDSDELEILQILIESRQ